MPYQQVITLVVPADTIVIVGGIPIDFWIDSIVLLNITNLPPGLSYQCESPSCGFPGGTSGCVLISGTPDSAGTYNLDVYARAYVTDKLGFFPQQQQDDTISYYFIVINPALSATISSTDITCNGNCDGTAAITHSGGTAPYTYLWNTNDTISTITGLCPANYNVIVEDKWGDTAIVSVIINEPTAIAITSVVPTNVGTCGGSDGTITITATGGTGALQDSITGYSYQPDGTVFTGLTVGNYAIVVQDSNGCTLDSTVTINDPGTVNIGSEVFTDITCNGDSNGTITIAASGGIGPLSYSIDGGSTYPSTTGTFTGLSAGNYNIAVQDSIGCTKTGSTITISDPPTVSIDSETYTDITCNGLTDGTITITASGGTGTLNYSIDSGSTFTNTTGIFTGLGAGGYDVAVQDSNACTQTGSTLNINEPALLTVAISSTNETSPGSEDGTVTLNVSGGTPPYTYNWGIDTIVTTDTVSTIDSLAPLTYIVTVTDVAGCFKIDSVIVGTDPVGIQPFEDLTNKVLVYPNPVVNELNIITSFDEQVIFTIYDIVGQQIKSVTIEGETTKVNTTELTEGMYIYQILSKEGIMLNRGKFSIAK